VGKINHDLRNILSTAVLVSDRLAHSDDPEVKRETPALMRAIDRAVALCEDTLSFVSAGGPQPRTVPVDLPALIDDVEGALALPADGAIAWHNAVAKGFTVTADRDQLFRVLLNLGRNAIEAMRGSGEIRVNARRDGRAAVIEVTDSGPGLPPQAREHLFEPFSGSARQGGTGLGLPIAREIMRAHGGELSLAKSDEAGTIFRLDLPMD
ncbi:MAG: PAS domain-containing sensor histidine kinase, partial [Alphaproteobacteria bacterium]